MGLGGGMESPLNQAEVYRGRTVARRAGAVMGLSAPPWPVSHGGAENATPKSEGESRCQLNLAVAVYLGSFNLAEVLSG